jgi:hypothetical protein
LCLEGPGRLVCPMASPVPTHPLVPTAHTMTNLRNFVPTHPLVPIAHTMTNLRNFVKWVSPAVRKLLRVGKLSAALFTVMTLAIIVWFAFILLALTVASHIGPVAGALTAIACFCVFVVTLTEIT